MVLSNKKIIEEIQAGNIFIGIDSSSKIDEALLLFDSTSVELHLANEFKIWKKPIPGEEISVNPHEPQFDFNQYAMKFTENGKLESDGSFILGSKEFVLCTTLEYVKLPENLTGRVEGRSKLARLGISIHITAPNIHAGWGGKITLEIFNHSPIAVKLRPGKSIEDRGLKIAQLTFERVDGELIKRPLTFSQDQETALGRSVRKSS